jgi:hypothetical protein
MNDGPQVPLQHSQSCSGSARTVALSTLPRSFYVWTPTGFSVRVVASRSRADLHMSINRSCLPLVVKDGAFGAHRPTQLRRDKDN